MVIYVAGRVNIDIIIEVDKIFKSGRKYRGRVIGIDIGGTAANIATAIARINSGFKPKLLGAIGKDYKHFIFEKLDADGIDLTHLKVLDSDTGKAYVFIDPRGSSTIVTIPGANDLYISEHIPDISDAIALVLGNTTLSAAEKLMSIMPSSIPLFIDPHELWAKISSRITYVENPCIYMPNEDEFMLYTGLHIRDIDKIRDYVHRVKCSIVIKRGDKGIIAIHKDQLIKIPAIPLDRLGLRAISTAGCGDTFTGVFTAMYILGKSFIESLKYATIAATLKATRFLSRAPPTMDELKNFIEVIENKNLINIKINSL